MKKCYDCTHVEMCGWRKEVKEQGCEFFSDGIAWIPVIEKLPEEAGYYLVTRMFPQKNEVYVDIDDYSPQERGHGLTGWFEAMFDDEWTAHNIAWMPLPEPYREDGA